MQFIIPESNLRGPRLVRYSIAIVTVTESPFDILIIWHL